ncbi:MAG TPA: hypothetical protein VGE52_14020, partial [Pirellulales bacterium]
MATIETSKEIQQTHKPHKVYARAKWRDEWVEQPNLYCDWFEKSAGPEVSRAALFWKYGRGIQPGKTTFENYSPKSLLWRYIKIVAEPSTDSTESEAKPIEWYGIVTDDQRALDGDLTHDGKKLENGDQVLGAVGMEVLLTKFTIEQSYVGTTEDSTEIDRGLTFNANIGSVYKGNRNSLGDGENFFFCKKASEGDHWNIGQVVQYLVDTWLFRNASAVSSDLV